MIEKNIKKRSSIANEVRLIGKLAFVFIAVLIVFCAFLMNIGLSIQNNILQASSISYEQEILVEHIGNKLLFLTKNISRPDVSEYTINDIRNDISILNSKIILNQAKLKKLITSDNFYLFFYKNGLSKVGIERLLAIDQLLNRFNKRINQIDEATMPALKSGYNFWQPVDMLVASNGKLPMAMESLNEVINDISLNQNKSIHFLYAILLILVLMGIWLIWYFTLRPLEGRLEKSYQEIQLKNKSLAFQAHHDSLTLLPNRSSFTIKMNDLCGNKELVGHIALLLIDIDNFKSINDTYGHYTGDQVLIEFAHRLADDKLDNEILYRLSGDEFAIIIHDIKDKKKVARRAHVIISNLRIKSSLFQRELPVHGSIGIAFGKYCGSSLQELFSAADIALYHAKNNGRNHFIFYDEISSLSISEVIKIENELYIAIDRREFIVYYQPIICLNDNSILKVEALLRWRHPKKGVLLPKQWMSIAERLSIFSSINMQVFDIIEKDYNDWLAAGLECPVIYVNITENMLLSGAVYERVKSMIIRSPSCSSWLAIEVTESVVLDRSFDIAAHQLKLLQELGIKIALDDFGTGFANLSHLTKIPFDVIKIDYSFISQILQDKNIKIIVELIINLAKSLGKEIVCEGVDSIKIRDEIFLMGCGFSQGFLHSPPLPFEEMGKLLLDKRV